MNGLLCQGLSQQHFVPSKAENKEGYAEEGGHCMSDQRIGVARTEVETKPEGSSQSEQLASHKVHLFSRESVW